MPSPGERTTPPATIRSQVRDAVNAAWASAVETGALSAIEDDAARPAVGIERPSNPAFGDLDIAESLAAALRDGPYGALIASAEVARPGFVNLRVADAAYETVVARILAEPDGWGRF